MAVTALHRLVTGQDPQVGHLAAGSIPAAIWMCGSAGMGPQASQEAVGLLQELAKQAPLQEGLVAGGAVAAFIYLQSSSAEPLAQAWALQGLLHLANGSPGVCEQAVQAGCIETALSQVLEVSFWPFSLGHSDADEARELHVQTLTAQQFRLCHCCKLLDCTTTSVEGHRRPQRSAVLRHQSGHVHAEYCQHPSLVDHCIIKGGRNDNSMNTESLHVNGL